MDIQLEQKDNKGQFLEDEIGMPLSKTVDEMKRLHLNKISSKNECDRVMNRLNKTLKNHKNLKDSK